MTDHTTHDLELLAAAASGYEPDRAAAEALLSSCQDCRTAYAEQLAIRSLLLEVGPVSMSAEEGRRLHAAMAAAYPAKVTPLAPRRAQPISPIWGRVMAAAAALAVIVGVGATVATQQGGDAAATTAGEQFEAAAPADFASGGSEERAAAETTAAAAATLYGLAAADNDDPARLKAEAESLDEAASEHVADDLCSDELAGLAIRASGESTYQGRPVLLLLVDDEPEPEARAFFADDCTEIGLP